MGSVLGSLVPLIIASAIVPGQILVNLLLLKSPQRGTIKAIAFVGGLTAMRLLQGVLFGLILTGDDSITAETKESSGPGPVVATLLMVLGLFLLITAYKQWRKEDDPDAPPPKWLSLVDSLTPLKALGIGFALLLVGAKFWVFTLSALGIIGEAQLAQPAAIVTYLLFVLLAESLLLLPILISLVAPQESKALLDTVSESMTRYNRPIVIIISLIFGLFFLYQGISGLLS